MAPYYNLKFANLRIWSKTTVAVSACVAIMVAIPSVAQQKSKSLRGSNVTIDYGVLNSLGPSPSLARPQNSNGGVAERRPPTGSAAATGKRIILTPPKKNKTKQITKRNRPARSQISKSQHLVRSPSRKPAKQMSKTAPAVKNEVTKNPQPKRGAQRTIPLPPQTATLTPARKTFSVGQSYRLAFGSGLSKLDEASTVLLDKIASKAKSDRSIRLKLLAYADATDQTASQSRRLSLVRALTVRAYLIDEGVQSVQFEVHANGKNHKGGPPDRVDIVVSNR